MGQLQMNTFVQNYTFMMGSEETDWGKMFVMTVGSFHVFVKLMTLISILQVKVNVFQETLRFIFSV